MSHARDVLRVLVRSGAAKARHGKLWELLEEDEQSALAHELEAFFVGADEVIDEALSHAALVREGELYAALRQQPAVNDGALSEAIEYIHAHEDEQRKGASEGNVG